LKNRGLYWLRLVTPFDNTSMVKLGGSSSCTIKHTKYIILLLFYYCSLLLSFCCKEIFSNKLGLLCQSFFYSRGVLSYNFMILKL
jgi:hypothetical protein